MTPFLFSPADTEERTICSFPSRCFLQPTGSQELKAELWGASSCRTGQCHHCPVRWSHSARSSALPHAYDTSTTQPPPVLHYRAAQSVVYMAIMAHQGPQLLQHDGKIRNLEHPMYCTEYCTVVPRIAPEPPTGSVPSLDASMDGVPKIHHPRTVICIAWDCTSTEDIPARSSLSAPPSCHLGAVERVEAANLRHLICGRTLQSRPAPLPLLLLPQSTSPCWGMPPELKFICAPPGAARSPSDYCMRWRAVAQERTTRPGGREGRHGHILYSKMFTMAGNSGIRAAATRIHTDDVGTCSLHGGLEPAGARGRRGAGVTGWEMRAF